MTELEQPSLKRVLEWIDGAALLIGVTIGAGIFATPQIIATYQSSFGDILWLWIGCGVFVMVGGLIYAELGTRVPATGGEYVYMYKAFGPFAAFMFGWAHFFIIRTSSAAGLSIITVNYFEYFVDLAAWQETVLALLVIAALGYINYIGIQQASLFQKITTVLKVGGLFLLVLLGLVLVGGTESQIGATAEPTSTMGPVGNTVAALMLVLFTYLGWDRVGYVAGEMKNPRRALPLSIFVGLGIVTYTYILSNYVFHLTLGIEGVRGSTIVASDLATYFVGSAGAGIVAVIVIISATGSINGTMMAAPRAFYAMARDGLFFKWFNFVHPTHRTPSNAIIAYCAWAAVILLVRGTFETIVAGMVFAVLIFYGFTTVALFVLRRRPDPEHDVYRMPGYPWLPVLYLAGIVALVALRGYYEWQTSLVDLAFVATGLPFALYWMKRPNKP